jgi:hypothetical protein
MFAAIVQAPPHRQRAAADRNGTAPRRPRWQPPAVTANGRRDTAVHGANAMQIFYCFSRRHPLRDLVRLLLNET